MNLFEQRLTDLLGHKEDFSDKVRSLFSGKRRNPLIQLPGWEKWGVLMDELDWLHHRLRDNHSRSVLENTVLYHLTHGHWKMKWRGENLTWRPSMAEVGENVEKIKLTFKDWELQPRSMRSIGFPLEVFLPKKRPSIIFDLEQYADPKNNIYAKSGDVIIDGGGCWGDSALYFASLAGQGGKVYCYEFIPENLGIMRRNFELNPELAARIEVIEKPLWSHSGETMEFVCDGPATRIKREGDDDAGILKFHTTTIDDLIHTNGVTRVDFIKLDIEGAEPAALKGASQSIRRFKPTMALCVYHDPAHFAQLARYIDSIQPGYLYSLDHMTTCDWETVLYASVS